MLFRHPHKNQWQESSKLAAAKLSESRAPAICCCSKSIKFVWTKGSWILASEPVAGEHPPLQRRTTLLQTPGRPMGRDFWMAHLRDQDEYMNKKEEFFWGKPDILQWSEKKAKWPNLSKKKIRPKGKQFSSIEITLLGTNISPEKSILKMILLFPR